MAKRTAIIDIGSNSARMAVYEKDGRFSFHLIKEIKSRVRIGEGAYEKDGILQPNAINRAFSALNEFSIIAKNLNCNKVLCVATSALRDAANANDFINKVYKDFGFKIKVIDGNKEAYLGGVAVNNMVYKVDELTTVDIGGGSTEFAKIKNGVITKTVSINLGTVRLKELFFDKKASIDKINDYIAEKLKDVDGDFNSLHVVAIGGTLRALGKLIMEKSNYPISTIHNFEYDLKDTSSLINKIAASNILSLKDIGIKKDRFDTIREGVAIFQALLEKLGAKKVITSGVGVREGVYLCDLLRNSHHRFPANFSLSVDSLLCRFNVNKKEGNFIAKCADELFETLAPIHQLENSFRYELSLASKLHSTGRNINFYQENRHSAYIILNSLNYSFTHKEKMLISSIVKFESKKIEEADIEEFKMLLPKVDIINWLIFIFSLAKTLVVDCSLDKISFKYENHSLFITSKSSLYLAKDLIKKLPKPSSFAIIIEKS
ncbi:MAG: Ppx/GppA family phosphatase [Campylobacteraceae bacterium]